MDADREALRRAVVEEVLEQVRSGDVEGAMCNLIDADAEAIPTLIAACRTEPSREVRAALLRALWWQTRTPLAIALLHDALRDRRDDGWKAALDGLVALASSESIAVLELVHAEEAAALRPDTNYLEWVAEALEQAREALAARTPAAG